MITVQSWAMESAAFATTSRFDCAVSELLLRLCCAADGIAMARSEMHNNRST